MNNELIIRKCNSCHAMVKILEDCRCDNCGIQCCGTQMAELKANSTDASFEKHIPTFEISGDEIIVKINHPMEKDHFIEWVSIVKENKEITVKLYPEQNAEAIFPYMPGATIYAYCNKHGLWKKDV